MNITIQGDISQQLIEQNKDLQGLEDLIDIYTFPTLKRDIGMEFRVLQHITET